MTLYLVFSRRTVSQRFDAQHSGADAHTELHDGENDQQNDDAPQEPLVGHRFFSACHSQAPFPLLFLTDC